MPGTKSTRTIRPKPNLAGKKFCGQAEMELEWLIRLLKYNEVKSILEVGSRYGNVLRRMAEDIGVDTAVAVDMPNGPWGRMNSARDLRENIGKLNEAGIKAHMILGNSRDPETIRAVNKLGPYDFVFIDGDHRYEGVKADWENYGQHARMCGFHDIDGAGQKTGREGFPVEVPKFWKEVKEGRQHQQCIEPGKRVGIGVVWNGPG